MNKTQWLMLFLSAFLIIEGVDMLIINHYKKKMSFEEWNKRQALVVSSKVIPPVISSNVIELQGPIEFDSIELPRKG